MDNNTNTNADKKVGKLSAEAENTASGSPPFEIFKCLGDKTRFEIVQILFQSDSYVELIASKLSVTPATVSFHLKKLENAGLVKCSREQFYMIYSLKREIFEKKVGELFKIDAPADSDAKYKDQIVSNFIKLGKLQTIPSQLKKREIIWEYIIKEFELGQEYSEKEVSETIRKYHEDYCTIRREFIGMGFMVRNHDIYKRIK